MSGEKAREDGSSSRPMALHLGKTCPCGHGRPTASTRVWGSSLRNAWGMLVSLKCLNTKGQAHKLGSERKGRSRGLEKTHSACMSAEDTWAIRTQTARDPLSGAGPPRTLLVLREVGGCSKHSASSWQTTLSWRARGKAAMCRAGSIEKHPLSQPPQPRPSGALCTLKDNTFHLAKRLGCSARTAPAGQALLCFPLSQAGEVEPRACLFSAERSDENSPLPAKTCRTLQEEQLFLGKLRAFHHPAWNVQWGCSSSAPRDGVSGAMEG